MAGPSRTTVLAAMLVVVGPTPMAYGQQAPGGQAPVVIDRILSRPNGEIVTQSDVWQAIELHLLPADSRTLDTGLRAIENRRLILAEVNRLPAREPEPEALAARRSAWEADLAAAGGDRAAIMSRYGVAEATVDTWLRNDARIADYLDQRFAATPEADRPAAIADWLGFLRQRAGLR